MFLPVEGIVVDAQHNGGVGAPRRRGDDDLARPAVVNMGGGAGGVRKASGAFHHNVHAQLRPGNVARLAFLEHTDGFAVNDQVAVVRGHGAGVGAVGAVVLEQVGGGGGLAQPVDGRQIQPVVICRRKRRAGHQPPDAAKAVNADTRHHLGVPPVSE